MASTVDLFFADKQHSRAVESQCVYCRASDRRNANHKHTIPPEMVLPLVEARTEECSFHTCYRISDSEASAFAQRTGDTGERKIVLACLPACCNRHNMVDVEGGDLAYLRQPAIFTAARGPLYD